jgi:hypothetical protein
MLLIGCQSKIKGSKILEIDGSVYLCKKVPNVTGYSSPSGKNPYTNKNVIVLNREFFECNKIKTEPPEMVLKTTYLGAVNTGK